jgi:hypothetical protein
VPEGVEGLRGRSKGSCRGLVEVVRGAFKEGAERACRGGSVRAP